MLRSLRSRLILASLLWTGGLLALMHMASLLFIHAFPRSQRIRLVGPIIFGWFSWWRASLGRARA